MQDWSEDQVTAWVENMMGKMKGFDIDNWKSFNIDGDMLVNHLDKETMSDIDIRKIHQSKILSARKKHLSAATLSSSSAPTLGQTPTALAGRQQTANQIGRRDTKTSKREEEWQKDKALFVPQGQSSSQQSSYSPSQPGVTSSLPGASPYQPSQAGGPDANMRTYSEQRDFQRRLSRNAQVDQLQTQLQASAYNPMTENSYDRLSNSRQLGMSSQPQMKRDLSAASQGSAANYPPEGMESGTSSAQRGAYSQSSCSSTLNHNPTLLGTPLLELLLDERELEYYHGKCSNRGIPIMQNAFVGGVNRHGGVAPGTWLIRYSNLNTFCLSAKASTHSAASKHTAPDARGYFHWPFKILGTHRKEIDRIFILFVSKYPFSYYDNGSRRLKEGANKSVDEHVRLIYDSFESFASMCFQHWGGIKFDWAKGVKKAGPRR